MFIAFLHILKSGKEFCEDKTFQNCKGCTFLALFYLHNFTIWNESLFDKGNASNMNNGLVYYYYFK